MADTFNTYIEIIDFEAWRELCVKEGTLRRFAKGEEFVSVGMVGRYIGYIVSGALKYAAYSADGTEHVMGLVFGDGFVADWPFCLYGQKAKLAIVAVSDCEIYCILLKTRRIRVGACREGKSISQGCESSQGSVWVSDLGTTHRF